MNVSNLGKSGIYKIANIINNKVYIGQTCKNQSFSRRFSAHRRLLINNSHDSSHLQNSWNKYGEENFLFEIVEIIEDDFVLTSREQFWVDKYESNNEKCGYNKRPIVDSNKGVKFSKECRQKMSEQRKGRMTGEKNPFYGKKHSEETKEKIRLANTGENHPYYGKKRPKEVGEKISASKTGNLRGEESCRAKLTWEQVNEIRKLYSERNYRLYSQRDLAKRFNVTKGAIYSIVHYQSWKEEQK